MGHMKLGGGQDHPPFVPPPTNYFNDLNTQNPTSEHMFQNAETEPATTRNSSIKESRGKEQTTNRKGSRKKC